MDNGDSNKSLDETFRLSSKRFPQFYSEQFFLPGKTENFADWGPRRTAWDNPVIINVKVIFKVIFIVIPYKLRNFDLTIKHLRQRSFVAVNMI